jgi:hypothetical protein
MVWNRSLAGTAKSKKLLVKLVLNTLPAKNTASTTQKNHKPVLVPEAQNVIKFVNINSC